MDIVSSGGIPADRRRALSALLVRLAESASIEVAATQLLRGLSLTDRLPRGARVYVPFLADANFHDSVAASRRLIAEGMHPVPHLPARALQSAAELNEWLSALTEAGGDSVLLIAGDRRRARGPFPDTLGILESGALLEHGINRIAVAGHPEGNPVTDRAKLDRALAVKRDYALSNDVELWIVTQFIFSSGRAVEWLRRVRDLTGNLRIHIGLPGPARLTTLISFAAQCGVGVSARVLKKQPGAARLLGRWTPDGLLRDLAMHSLGRPDAAMDGIHVYPFGGVAATTEWLNGLRTAAPAARNRGRAQ